MSESFELLKERAERVIVQSGRPDKKVVLARLLDAWADLEKQGVEAFDFAHVAVLVAECAMQSYDSLEELEAFGVHLKDRGSSVIRCVQDHWPPVDPDKWPEGCPEVLRDKS